MLVWAVFLQTVQPVNKTTITLRDGSERGCPAGLE